MTRKSPFPIGASVVAYLRDSGGDEQELSVQQQERAVRAWCQEYGHPLTKLFIDEARSGTTTSGRDQFLEMVYHFRDAAPEAGIVIWNHRRFARNYNDALYYKADIRRRGYIIHSLNDTFPEGTDGLFFESAYDWMAEKKSEETSYEAKRGLHDLVRVHHAVPGTPPRGFKRQPKNIGTRRDGTPHIVHKWVPDPDVIPTIQKAFQLRANQVPLAQIQEETRLYNSLNSYATFFSNPIYIGQLHYADFVIEDYCEPIVDKKTWETVQRIREKYRANQNLTGGGSHHPRRRSSSFPLSGILHCVLCDSPMSGHKSKQRNGSYYRRYECSRAKRHSGCDAKRVPAGTLEKAVINTLTAEILNNDFLTFLDASYQKQREDFNRENDQRHKTLRSQLITTRRKIRNITKAIAETGHSNALLKSLKVLEIEEGEIQNQLSNIQEKPDLPPPLELNKRSEIIQTLKQQLTTTDPHTLRQILRGIIQRVTVERTDEMIQGYITFYYPFSQVKKNDKITTVPLYRPPVGAYFNRVSRRYQYSLGVGITS